MGLNYKYAICLVVLFAFCHNALPKSQSLSKNTKQESNHSTLNVEGVNQEGDIPLDADLISNGKSIFVGNCKQCHAVHTRVIGPALSGVYDRLELSYLSDWIRNSQKVIASGDEYAVSLYEEYGQVAMPVYNFTDEEILGILAYIKDETIKGPPQEETTASAEGAAQSTSSGMDTSFFIALLVVLMVVLILILIVLGLIVSVLVKYLKTNQNIDDTDREIVEKQLSFSQFIKSNAVLGSVVFIFSALALKTLIDGAFTIGVQQGYQPTQPIAFSHQLHAGQYEIDCNYCHTGVRKSKSANIPSANICMNCHSEILTDSEEIKKIYAAIDYDPKTKTYGNNTKPIEWVRIHNLPDHAYFNHAQHVAVGEVECQTCHGPIEEMEVVYQFANLTMGWCINCHRETELNADNNGYYDKLVKLHEENSNKPMKVEDNGGLECSKCHY